MTKKQILLINDIAGYGKVGSAAMMPILSYMGYPTCNLPTMIVSNTFGYSAINTLDTTDYIKGTFPVWEKLNFSFEAIATGTIASEIQAQIVSAYCKEQTEKGSIIFVDPIMGDEGKLYNSLTPATIQSMREMVSVAHLTYPNHTEACYLTDTPYDAKGMTLQEARTMIDKIRAIGAKSVLITSIPVDGQTSVIGYNHSTGQYFQLPFHEIPVRFPGTGDIFSAILIGHLLNGEPLKQSTRKAMDTVYKLIDANKDNEDKNCGIPLERYLNTVI